jgi:hypothetical protein
MMTLANPVAGLGCAVQDVPTISGQSCRYALSINPQAPQILAECIERTARQPPNILIVAFTANWGRLVGLNGDLPNINSWLDGLCQRTHCTLRRTQT